MNHDATILIVDDNTGARETFRGLLGGLGYNLGLACDGAEALDQIEALTPDLILLDVMMPKLDGFEVCQRLKTEPRWRHIPVILITALDSTEALVRGLEAGADDFLTKPVNGLELRARVRSMLRIKAQYDALEKQQRELETSLHLNRKFARAIGRHLETMEILHGVGLRLMDNLATDTVLELIAQAAFEIIPEATGCVMHLVVEGQPQLLPVIFSAEANSKIVQPSLGIEPIAARVIDSQKAIQVADIHTDPGWGQPELPDMRSLLVIPLIDAQRSLGTLTVSSAESDIFNESHRHVLSILADQAAVTIRKARFFEARERASRQKQQAIRNLFQRYVSPAVVDRLVDGMENLSLGGEHQEISVLFADIRGFTTFSEKLAPKELVKVLNQYLALAVEAILAQEGTLDKFMGDAVMAFFNAPLSQPDHTFLAVRAAVAMQRAIAAHNAGMTSHQPLDFGIGIHVGQAVVGNIGTVQQMNYTAVGDTVNLAKRLEENARDGQIILSREAYEAVKGAVIVEDLGPLTVKGRTAVVHAYELKELNT